MSPEENVIGLYQNPRSERLAPWPTRVSAF
jgi:hypothetical protein